METLRDQRWLHWRRAAAVAATLALIFVVYRQIEVGEFQRVLREARPLIVLGGLAIYSVALWLSAWRWQLALGLVNCRLHSWLCLRFMLIGHFFFVALLGAVAGDVAKSAVYARWYRREFPEVVAAAPLDRLLALGGLVPLVSLSLLSAWVGGGFARAAGLDWQATSGWRSAMVIGLCLLALAVALWPWKGSNPWIRAIRRFRDGVRQWVAKPALAGRGLLLGFVSQAMLAAVLAANLAAVHHGPLPWFALAWTFPVITALSCLPFTVAGAGVREVSAVSLLGLYGVPAVECVAAATLTLAMKLGLAGVGGLALWREQGRQAANCKRPAVKSISVVIPTLNEAAEIGETVRRVRAEPEVMEVIVVDGGSTDGTREVAARLGCRVLGTRASRGGQLRAGAASAHGDVVLLLHADTWLPAGAGQALLDGLRDCTVVGGGFWKEFREPMLLLRGSKWRCGTRLFWSGMIFGDQGLFVRREVLEGVGGVPDLPVMEEFELCRRLRQAGRLALAGATVHTSARRFQKLGVLRTYWRMYRVWWLFRRGVALAEIKRIYERE